MEIPATSDSIETIILLIKGSMDIGAKLYPVLICCACLRRLFFTAI
jgi:hypothetical protein